MSGATGGSYSIITNNGPQDKILLASDRLLERINKIKNEKLKKVNTNLDLLYDKFNNLKKELEFSPSNSTIISKKINIIKKQIDILKKTNTMPTIADINTTHNFYLNRIFKPFVSIGTEYSKSIVSIKPQFGGTCKFKIPIYGDFFSDMVLYIKLSAFSAINPVNKVKYCDFLGHRLINNTKMELDGEIIDQYTSEDYNFYYQYSLPLDKQDAWKKCIGQEIPIEAYLTSDPELHEFREVKMIKNGPQTLKKVQPMQELFVPLLFWFTDSKYAMMNNNIPTLQSYIEFDFGTRADMTYCDNVSGDNGKLYVQPTIEECALYVKHIFVCPDILEIFINRTGFSLIRTHRSQQLIVNNSYADVVLDKFKWPTEVFYMSFRPMENLNNENSMETWYLNNKLTLKNVKYPVIFGAADVLGQVDAYYYEKQNIIHSLCMGCNEISIYENISSPFFNAYLPYKHSKTNYMSADDTGSFMMNFYLDTDLTYQPNGYLNLSKTSNLSFSYHSHHISSEFPCQLTVSSKSINFLLLDENKCKLYYTL
jgi:hypothetical protein